jgi:hypothetical protein
MQELDKQVYKIIKSLHTADKKHCVKYHEDYAENGSSCAAWQN